VLCIIMLSAAAMSSMIPRAVRFTPMLARTAVPTAARVSFARVPVAMPAMLARGYASGGGLSLEDIKTRITDVIKSFEKVDPNMVKPEAKFTDDLGLDSLDAVEVVMAIEEEFNIEIPDADADAITSVQEAINYISNTPDGMYGYDGVKTDPINPCSYLSIGMNLVLLSAYYFHASILQIVSTLLATEKWDFSTKQTT